jgi:predicted nuclease of predicted toxin-antitoxin system
MRILANENFPGPLIRELRRLGHDVLSVKETMRGATDLEVLERSRQEERLVVTFDKDFGELAFRFGLSTRSGIILFRLSGPSPEADNTRVLAAFASEIDWTGHFSVVTADRIRVRPLP